MIAQLTNQLMTLDEFLDWYPDGYGRYELHRGVVFEMQPTGTHEEVISFITGKLFFQIESLGLPYLIPKQALIKPLDNDKSAYNPDVMVIDQTTLNDEPLWKKRSTITKGKSVPLVIEVVSTNWQDDYAYKLVDYEKLAIPEYWIVDYLGLGGKRHIGNPKQPTISIYQLIDNEYQIQQFRGEDVIISSVFPELKIRANQLFYFGQ
ncbi:MAG TPA: Uma2 family endonuclease [Allocoleopsis sp.]